MNTFIDRIAEHLLHLGKEQLLQTIVIFPNRRPIAFLLHALQSKTETPIFAPQCYSIKDFVFSISEYNPTDTMVLLFELYKVYLKLHTDTTKHYSIEQFIASGETMLADFNDIDHYMINNQDIFQTLTEAKAIEMWNPGKSQLTDKEKEYFSFFQSLQNYYSVFKEVLANQHIAYDGMAFRHIAETAAKNKYYKENHTYIFAGFNALTKAETSIINHFVSGGKAKLFWDADTAYINDSKHEAGMFLRAHFKNLQSKDDQIQWLDDEMLNSKKNIHIVGAPLTLSQIKYAMQELDKISTKKDIKHVETAIVPCDESMLYSLLESIPNSVESTNITMGFPIQLSVAYEFIDAFISLHTQSYQSKNGKQFQLKKIVRFFQHPFLNFAFIGSNLHFHSIIQHMLKQYMTMYTSHDIIDVCSVETVDNESTQFIKRIFTETDSPKQLVESAILLFKRILNNTNSLDEFNVSVIHALIEVLEMIDGYLEHDEVPISNNAFEYLFSRLSSSVKVTLEGEPLEGLQIIGMLETRCLDFKNVFILNMNEGFMPKSGRFLNTFIPYDVRKHFGLPLPGHDSAMYAYYFYRLIQRAENIWLLYNTEPDSISGKEMSRYIKQLLFELKQKSGNNWNVNHDILRIANESGMEGVVRKNATITKSEFAINRLIQIAEKGFSFSRLWDYVECPFRFYLKSIVRIKKPEDIVGESIEINMLGEIIHLTLENIYNTCKGEILDKEQIKQVNLLIEKQLQHSFQTIYPRGNIKQGKNLLITKVAQKIISSQIRADESHISSGNSLLIIDNERELNAYFCSESGTSIAISGKIDRIDSLNGQTRLIDYKTGKIQSLTLIKKKDQTIQQIDFSQLQSQQFQLLYYLLLYEASTGKRYTTDDSIPQAGIIGLRSYSPSTNMLILSKQQSVITFECINTFRTYIAQLFRELFQTDIPFERTNNAKKCKFCDYQDICNNFAQIEIEEDEN